MVPKIDPVTINKKNVIGNTMFLFAPCQRPKDIDSNRLMKTIKKNDKNIYFTTNDAFYKALANNCMCYN